MVHIRRAPYFHYSVNDTYFHASQRSLWICRILKAWFAKQLYAAAAAVGDQVMLINMVR